MFSCQVTFVATMLYGKAPVLYSFSNINIFAPSVLRFAKKHVEFKWHTDEVSIGITEQFGTWHFALLLVNMSLYHRLVFVILVVELITLTLLGMPLPSKWKRPVVSILAKPFLSPTVQMTIKCVLCFILLLFVDSINKVYNIENELDRLRDVGRGSHPEGKLEILSRKFYWQRNMYLNGITLFLTFTLTRTAALVWELFDLKDSYASLAKSKKDDGEETKLKEEIKSVDEEISNLKEKALALQQEMN